MKDDAALDDPRVFNDLAELAVRANFASVVVLPLLVLYDSAKGVIVQKDWHVVETVRLLSDDCINSLESLYDVRRLLRRGLPETISQTDRDAMANSIRGAGAQDSVRIRELSDLQNWNVLTTEESAEVAGAIAADEIDPPADPRTESLFTVDHSPPPERPERGTGWPHPDDDASVRLLQRGVAGIDAEAGQGAQLTDLDQQLHALGVIMARPEALGDEWLGRTIGWGQRAIQQLRRTVEIEDGDDNGAKAE